MANYDGSANAEGNVTLLNVKEKSTVWAGEAGDRSLIYGGFEAGRPVKLLNGS
jgi:hypothetical protein